jgi:ornithine cyclodeaminase/alanine dehydrogenase-like protein (mu-crystallin family)
MTLTVLDAAATAAALPYPRLADALETMLARKRAGTTVAPERLAVPLTGGMLLAMPAADREFAVTKLVTVHAGNAAHGLPSLLGEVLLMKADTGERLLMLDGPTVTGRRTAALSALAARRLGAPRGANMLVIGAGVQARAHIAAFAELLDVRTVRIASRSPASAHALADEARAQGLQADAVADPGSALARSAIVITATTATAPVLPDTLGGDAFVAAVGAYRPDMCELPASLVLRSRVLVDDLPGARHEAGDILQAGRDFASVEALEDVLHEGRTARDGRPVVFKSVGQALWDLAAARLAWEIAGSDRQP